MHAFAPQAKASQQTASPKSVKPAAVSCGQSCESTSTSSSPKLARLGHDFGRINLHSAAPRRLQAKLTVSTPEDVFEQEADRVAAQVMRTPDPQINRACDCGGGCAECQTGGASQTRDQLQLQRVQASDTGKTAPPSLVDEVLGSPGQPLDDGTRRFMESRLQHDFARVRVHTDEQATRSAQELGALAYTVGPHVVFQKGRFNPGSRDGKQLLAHELAHVVQQGAAANSETSLSRAASSGPVLQRQSDGGTTPPAETPAAPPATPASPAAPSGTGVTPQAVAPLAAPVSNWTGDVPYIWFDLHDFYKALTEPAGPYLYSSHVRVDRVDNPNFSNNLNPGPARDTNTLMPDGSRHAQPSDLLWFFYTKFYVDSAAAPLPPAFTIFRTSADITFTPSGGGPGFADRFMDNSPTYLSPNGLSFPFALGTTPYAFRAQHNIMQPGVLVWNARLSMSTASTAIPIRLEYTAPPQIRNEAAMRAELATMRVPFTNAPPGTPARTFRVTFTASGPGRFRANVDVISAEGTAEGTRTLQNLTAEGAFESMAIVLSLLIDRSFLGGQFGSSSDRHVEINGSQRVRFDVPRAAASPSATPSPSAGPSASPSPTPSPSP
jgi:hypothetical protein